MHISTCFTVCLGPQVRNGNILDLNGRLFQVTKFQHTQGSGRQLGNVQVSTAHLCISRLSHSARLRATHI